MTERKMSWKVLKIFAHECYSDDLGFYLDCFSGKVKFAFWAFMEKEFMKLVEEFGAIVTDPHPHLFHRFRNKYFNKLSLDSMLSFYNPLYKF